MKSKKNTIAVILIIFIAAVIAGTLYVIKLCLDLTNNDADITASEQTEIRLPSADPTETTEPPTETTLPEPEHVVATASIGAMGDLLMHKPIFDDLTEYNAAVQHPEA